MMIGDLSSGLAGQAQETHRNCQRTWFASRQAGQAICPGVRAMPKARAEAERAGSKLLLGEVAGKLGGDVDVIDEMALEV